MLEFLMSFGLLAMMGAVVSFTRTCTIAGVNFNNTVNREGDFAVAGGALLPAAVAGTLTTRTDANTGIVTVTAHTIGDSDTVALFWEGGRRYGVDVTGHTGTTISIDVGSGDDLPVITTPVTIVKETRANVSIDGDNAKLIALTLAITDPSAATKGRVDFFDATDTLVVGFDLVANGLSVIDVVGGDTNPYTGAPITYAMASNASSVNSATLTIGNLYDGTP